jgi:hypothetical protein
MLSRGLHTERVADETPTESGRYVAVPTSEQLGIRPVTWVDPDPIVYWYPRRRGEAMRYYRKLIYLAVAVVFILFVVAPLVVWAL